MRSNNNCIATVLSPTPLQANALTRQTISKFCSSFCTKLLAQKKLSKPHHPSSVGNMLAHPVRCGQKCLEEGPFSKLSFNHLKCEGGQQPKVMRLSSAVWVADRMCPRPSAINLTRRLATSMVTGHYTHLSLHGLNSAVQVAFLGQRDTNPLHWPHKCSTQPHLRHGHEDQNAIWGPSLGLASPRWEGWTGEQTRAPRGH